MAAITDLSSAGSTTTTDYFVVSQSGTDRKAQVFALANTFSQVQTFTAGINTGDVNLRPHVADNNHSLDISDGSTLTLANTVTFALSSNSTFRGLVLISNTSDTQVALFLCGGGSVTRLGDPTDKYSTAQGTASKTNLYYSGAVNKYILENFTGASRTYNIFSIRLGAGS